MRVLDTHTGQFKDDMDPKKDKYAILSHTWTRDSKDEQTYQKLRKIQRRYTPSDDSSSSDEGDSSPPQPLPTSSDEPTVSPIWADPELSPKIREACRIARENGYRFIWIDSCCIDKTSSSELSESINSMYQWYARAEVCYAYLPDVPAEDDHQREESHFRLSRWFTRGWTLQELIAPLDVRFLSMEWTFIGSKESLADLVVEITHIHYNALLNIEPLDEFSVAQRFSWAATRKTTREEDRAYSLLGIFDINLPTLYGEGERAFRRLQEEIMRRTPDQSLFAWTLYELPNPSSQIRESHSPTSNEPNRQVYLYPGSVSDTRTFFAPSLDVFSRCTDITALSHDEVARRLHLQPDELSTTDYSFTPYGIRIQLPVILLSDCFHGRRITSYADVTLEVSQWSLVILGCEHDRFPGHLLVRVCFTETSGSSLKFLLPGLIKIDEVFDLFPLPPATIANARSSGSEMPIQTFYIPQPERDGVDNIACLRRHETIKLVLPEKTRKTLSAQGYTPTLRSPDDAHPRTHSLVLSHNTLTITIDYQHTLEEHKEGGQKLVIEAHVKTSMSAGPALQGTDTPSDLRPGVLGASYRVEWRDSMDWVKELGFRDVALSTIPFRLTARLGLTLATTNRYLLRIELNRTDRPSQREHSGHRN